MKKIIVVACLLAASLLSSNSIFAKEVIATGTINVPDRKFTCTEDPELGPLCDCPLSPTPQCNIYVTLYDDLSYDVDLGEKRIPNPGPLSGTAQEMAEQFATRVMAGESFSYEP